MSYLCLLVTPLLTIFQLYHGSQFYWSKKQEYTEKFTDKLFHIKLYQVLQAMSGTRTCNFSGDRYALFA